MERLRAHKVYDLDVITSIPIGQKAINSRRVICGARGRAEMRIRGSALEIVRRHPLGLLGDCLYSMTRARPPVVGDTGVRPIAVPHAQPNESCLDEEGNLLLQASPCT